MKNKIIPLLAMLAVMAVIAAFYILSNVDLSAADRTTSKIGSPASPYPQSSKEFQYEMTQKWNKGVNDLDSLYDGAIDTIRAEAVGIGTTSPECQLHIKTESGAVCARLESTDPTTGVMQVQLYNDSGYELSIGKLATGLSFKSYGIGSGAVLNEASSFNFIQNTITGDSIHWWYDTTNFTLNNGYRAMSLSPQGYLTIAGELYAQFVSIDSAWEDMRFAATPGQANPVTDKPDFNFDEIGFLFPQADSTEIIYITAQMPHAWIEGTDVEPHVHWKQTEAAVATWVMAYKWFNIGSDPDTVPWDTIRASVGEVTYVSGSLHQITEVGEIDGTGKTKSSLMSIKIWRNDNDLTGDALYYEFDIHYKKDKIGSREEYE